MIVQMTETLVFKQEDDQDDDLPTKFTGLTEVSSITRFFL